MRVDRNLGTALAALALIVVACGGAGPQSTPTPTPSPSALASPSARVTATATATASAGATASATASAGPTGTATQAGPTGTPFTGSVTLAAPEAVSAGGQVEVAWTGPNAFGDFVAIMPVGATAWVNEHYFDTVHGTPGRLVAPTTPGAYELWYISGDERQTLARRAITVTPFVGSLSGPDEVEAGSQFDVGWTGTNGPNDYVTIVAVGTAAWSGESFFYTHDGTPGTLVAPIEAGSHELWYVAGTELTTMVRRPITVTPYVVTLDAPAEVQHGSQFSVTWTGPDGPSDYITVVAVGAPANAYLSYAYTAAGSPSVLTAPDAPGSYEVRYSSDRVGIVFASRPITVK